jgi:uncharacterized protein (DUF4415 family)
MQNEFDPEKARLNPHNHEGVPFDEAKVALLNLKGRMSNNSDPTFKQYADMDFSTAKPVKDIPALAKLQAAQGGKSRITMRVDNATLAVFKVQAEMTGGSYQTLMNEALAEFAQGRRLADVVRETIMQELHSM